MKSARVILTAGVAAAFAAAVLAQAEPGAAFGLALVGCLAVEICWRVLDPSN